MHSGRRKRVGNIIIIVTQSRNLCICKLTYIVWCVVDVGWVGTKGHMCQTSPKRQGPHGRASGPSVQVGRQPVDVIISGALQKNHHAQVTLIITFLFVVARTRDDKGANENQKKNNHHRCVCLCVCVAVTRPMTGIRLTPDGVRRVRLHPYH